MNFWLGLFLIVSATAGGCFCVVQLWRNARLYRTLYIETGVKWEAAVRELREWVETCQRLVDERIASDAKHHREFTKQAAQLDSLLHGDCWCINRHRYYAEEGNCPHCAAMGPNEARVRALIDTP